MNIATRVPLSVGAIHFIGIGGIGMSGIAEVMHNLGYAVRGSDANDSANVKRLRGFGIPIEIGHSTENLGPAQVVVYSSAVRADNPEIIAAREAGLPIVRRAEMLAELAEFCACADCRKVLIRRQNTKVGLAPLDIYDLGKEIAKHHLQIAVVETHNASDDDVNFLETVAQNRGGPIHFFDDEESAKRWLQVH